MDLYTVRRLSAAIAARAAKDWFISNLQDVLFFRRYGGKEAELKSFYFSEYCDDMLRLVGSDLTGPEMWRLLVTGQAKNPKYIRIKE